MMKPTSDFAANPLSPSRREFLGVSAAVAASALGGTCRGAVEEKEPIAFFLVSDTHFLADKERPGTLDPRSECLTRRFVETLNSLPGTPIEDADSTRSTVRTPRGVLHAGDVIDSGDKTGRLYDEMQRTEWESYVDEFGLTGSDGRLRYPVYEVHGNHDGPQGKGVAVDGIRTRNESRPGVDHVSDNGLHYAWSWGPVRFLNLGIVVGNANSASHKRRYDPLDSLAFLQADLAKYVGDSGRPVVITHHVDVVRYALPCEADAPSNLKREWNPCDVKAFYEAIRPYRIAAILYGHTHARSVRRWDGAKTDGETGVTLYNVDNSSHFSGANQAFFYFEIDGGSVTVRERATTDGWVTSNWTPQVWRSDSAS